MPLRSARKCWLSPPAPVLRSAEPCPQHTLFFRSVRWVKMTGTQAGMARGPAGGVYVLYSSFMKGLLTSRACRRLRFQATALAALFPRSDSFWLWISAPSCPRVVALLPSLSKCY